MTRSLLFAAVWILFSSGVYGAQSDIYDEPPKTHKKGKADTNPWIALPAPAPTENSNLKPEFPLDSKGRIKAHIIKSESEVRYLINNLEKNEIYPKILKSFYFYRNVPGQWDKKKAIGLIDARMKTMPAGESKLWFQLAGVDAYARRYTQNVPDPGPSYAMIFSHAKKLSELDVELFYRLIKEMSYNGPSFKRGRQPRSVGNLSGIVMKLLPVYMSMPKLSDEEPVLPALSWNDIVPYLKNFDNKKDRSFNEIYRSMFISQPGDLLKKRISTAIRHPEFAKQPDSIKRRLYLHMANSYDINGKSSEKRLMWLKKAAEAGAGYSLLLNFYFSSAKQFKTSNKRLKYLEKKFAYLKNEKKGDEAKKGAPVKGKQPVTREIAEFIEKNYVPDPDNALVYCLFQEKLNKKYPNVHDAFLYMDLVQLRKYEKSRKKFIAKYNRACNEILKKALSDSGNPDDAMNIYKFLIQANQKDLAYKYLDNVFEKINDPSETKLRIAYILAKEYAKHDIGNAVTILSKVDLSKYDTGNGGRLAFYVKMVTNYKARLKKLSKKSN